MVHCFAVQHSPPWPAGTSLGFCRYNQLSHNELLVTSFDLAGGSWILAPPGRASVAGAQAGGSCRSRLASPGCAVAAASSRHAAGVRRPGREGLPDAGFVPVSTQMEVLCLRFQAPHGNRLRGPMTAPIIGRQAAVASSAEPPRSPVFVGAGASRPGGHATVGAFCCRDSTRRPVADIRAGCSFRGAPGTPVRRVGRADARRGLLA